MLGGVVSSVVFISCLVSTPVSLATARFGPCLNVQFSWRPASTRAKTIQGGPKAGKKCDPGRRVSVSVARLMYYPLFGWMLCLLCCLHLLLTRALVCFNVSFACVSTWGEKEEAGESQGGTKCSSVPKTPPPREVCLVLAALVLERGDEQCVVYQSYSGVLDGILAFVPWCLGPLYDSGCVFAGEMDTGDGGCGV